MKSNWAPNLKNIIHRVMKLGHTLTYHILDTLNTYETFKKLIDHTWPSLPHRCTVPLSPSGQKLQTSNIEI